MMRLGWIIVLLLLVCLCTVPCTCHTSESSTIYQAANQESSSHDPSLRQLQQPRIVGGSDARRNEFPYFVQMGLCGGTLIAPGVVMSTAHCKDILLPGTYVTIHPLNVKDLQGTRVKIVERLFHPNYDEDWTAYDFSLLRLEKSIGYTDNVDTNIQLTVNEDPTFPPDNVTLTVIGFGELMEGSNRYPLILQKVNVESMNLEACNQTMDGEILNDSMFCAGSQEANKDSCQGDSGGPLLYKNGNKHVLTGLVSWGEGCGIAGVPGVYARVSKAMPWVKKIVCDCWNVKGASFCTTDTTAEQQRSEQQAEFTCHLRVDPNCQDTFGYQDYVGDGCDWHESYENPGCVDHGDSPGGRGFEGTNAKTHCCWCGGGKIVEPEPQEQHPDCQDIPDWADQFQDDCSWYEANTEEGTCSGWGGLYGWKGFRTTTPEMACCHCGGGVFPTPAPTPRPTTAPTPSRGYSLDKPTVPPTKAPASIGDGPTSSVKASSWGIVFGTVVLLTLFQLLMRV